MTTLETPRAPVVGPAPLLFPGRRQFLPQGMAAWEPDGYDDGDLDDLPFDDREVAEVAGG